MKQNTFETRQRAQELLDEAVKIWSKSPYSEQFESLAKDPVMMLLFSALAWQHNEADSDLEMLKEEIVREFLQILTPYELGHALPATAVIEASLKKDVGTWDVDADSIFKLSSSSYQFMPLLRTKVINASVGSITRLDGRRWKVTLDFASPIKDLSGFCFTIRNLFYKDLKVSYKGHYIPLIKPGEYSKMPLTVPFSAISQTPSLISLDIFARQNARIYCIKSHDASGYLPSEVEQLSLVFEFTGLSDQFVFDRKQLSINTILLAETQLEHATLTTNNPIVRASGYTKGEINSTQFMHLVPDNATGESFVEVRRVSADRFNRGRLTWLLSALVNKFHTDFYAFQDNKELANDATIQTLREILIHLQNANRSGSALNTPGTYILLKKGVKETVSSIDISYLTTHGSATNYSLNADSTFIPPAPFDTTSCQQIVPPTPGTNEIDDKPCEESLLRYHIITNNRIVTPADIKAFCYNELHTHYGIDSSLVSSIMVSPRPLPDVTGPGYELVAEITLHNNSILKRTFVEKIPMAEILMEKMMGVRSASIYPIRVSIEIENND